MVNGEEIIGTFHDVLFVSNLRVNLFSVGTATESDMEVNFKGTNVFFCKDDITIMAGKRVWDFIYSLRVTPVNCKQGRDSTAVASSTVPIQLLHQRFAHTNCRDLRRTIQLGVVKDVNLDSKQIDTADPCGGCLYDNMYRLPFNCRKRESRKLGRSHSWRSGYGKWTNTRRSQILFTLYLKTTSARSQTPSYWRWKMKPLHTRSSSAKK